MTEPRGAGAHWGAAVVVAPATAALMALSTGWALEHDPSPQPVAAPPAPVAHADADPPQRTDLTLEQRARAERAYVVALHRQLAHLQARVAAVRRAPVPTVPTGPTGPTGGSGSVPAPPRVAAAPAPAPAPATHTSTGAS